VNQSCIASLRRRISLKRPAVTTSRASFYRHAIVVATMRCRILRVVELIGTNQPEYVTYEDAN
jgi:hypothetical protein